MDLVDSEVLHQFQEISYSDSPELGVDGRDGTPATSRRNHSINILLSQPKVPGDLQPTLRYTPQGGIDSIVHIC
jgi:hypothetical protein